MPVVGEVIQFQFGCFTVGGPMNLFKVTDHGLAVFYALKFVLSACNDYYWST